MAAFVARSVLTRMRTPAALVARSVLTRMRATVDATGAERRITSPSDGRLLLGRARSGKLGAQLGKDRVDARRHRARIIARLELGDLGAQSVGRLRSAAWANLVLHSVRHSRVDRDKLDSRIHATQPFPYRMWCPASILLHGPCEDRRGPGGRDRPRRAAEVRHRACVSASDNRSRAAKTRDS